MMNSGLRCNDHKVQRPITVLGLPARVSCALALAALTAACAPAPQEVGYQLIRPAVGGAYYPQQPFYSTPDTDPVITPPAPAPKAPPDKSAELQLPPAPAPLTPAAPTPAPADRSPTCGYWRFGCGILWQ